MNHFGSKPLAGKVKGACHERGLLQALRRYGSCEEWNCAWLSTLSLPLVAVGHADAFHALDFPGPFGLGFMLGAEVAIDDRHMAERLSVVVNGGGVVVQLRWRSSSRRGARVGSGAPGVLDDGEGPGLRGAGS